MKFFIYKLLIICFFVFITFHLTFGYTLRNYESKIVNNLSKDKINYLKDKIRNEIKNSLQKDNILDKEDALLIKDFLKKISNELR